MKKMLLGLVGAGVLTMGYGCGGKQVDLGSSSGGANSGGASSGGSSTGGTNTGGSSTGGTNTGGSSTGGSSTGGSGGVVDDGVQKTSSKLDVLFVIDNSLSMADKQDVLRKSATDFVLRLVNPLCVDQNQNYTAEQPASAEAPCPAGATREFKPARDMHLGVITSSLGGHGADICSPQNSNFNPTQDDKAHLIPSARTPSPPQYASSGFLKWDPDGTASPPGEANASVLAANLQEQVVAAGENGCGFESQLEAMYRFLIDPEPPAAVVLEAVYGQAVIQGIDDTVLSQRAAFLRDDSAVLVVILSDENDCSVADGGISWLSGQASQGAGSFHLPQATTACASSPNDPCCRSCGLAESNPPAGCAPLTADPACGDLHNPDTDALNLRCWQQKRRFGIDFLYPVERYVDGLTQPTIANRAGDQVQNPLFAGGRHHSLVSVAAIVGVPWQDLARDPDDASSLEYLSAPELQHLDRWDVIVGNPEGEVPPTDPFMLETGATRSGTNPITGQAITETTTNPVNGHEFNATPNDLQYACIFPIAAPFDCAVKGTACDCTIADGARNKPLCEGTMQTHGKAYPAIRELDLLRRLGKKSVASSICARNVDDPSRQDFGYRPAVRAIIERLNRSLD